MLLSYAWLVCHKSDLGIAVETGLLPVDIDWLSWTTLMLDFARHVDADTLQQVDERYWYAELRLSRLNALYRFGAAGFSCRNMMLGFMDRSPRYTTFFGRHFGWILVVLVYLTVILTAMQVALATEAFAGDIRFQQFSYGLSLASIAAVLAAVLIMLIIWAVLFLFHLLSTVQYNKMATLRRHQRSHLVT
jgi:hypothetical protein